MAEFVESYGRGYDRLPASAFPEDAAELVPRRPGSRRYDPIVIETDRGDLELRPPGQRSTLSVLVDSARLVAWRGEPDVDYWSSWRWPPR